MKIEAGDFKNLQGIVAVVNDAAKLGDAAIGQFGGEGLQKTVSDFKSWVNAAKGDVERIGAGSKGGARRAQRPR